MNALSPRYRGATGSPVARNVVLFADLCPAVRPTLLAAFCASSLLMPISHAAPLPTQGSVVSGVATMRTDGASQMQIQQQSDRAVIQWDAFDIAEGARVDVSQPSADALLINRVMGAGPSQIAGTLRANGSVVLVNRNGINLKKSASVETRNFLASGTDITDDEIDALAQDWQAGDAWHESDVDGDAGNEPGTNLVSPAVYDRARGRTRGGISPAAPLPARHAVFPDIPTDRGGSSVVNQGRIRVKNGGHVGLLGAHVTHVGVIIADGGHIAIAGLGHQQGDRSASIDAVIGADATVNVTGLLRANTITRGVNEYYDQRKHYGPGRIAIDGRSGAVSLDGSVMATVEDDDTRSAGGDVAITGRHVRLSHAVIDVLGATSGGRIAITTQGPYAGLQRIDIDQGSSLLAQGSGAGNGGDILIKSAGQTVFDGTAVASGNRAELREIYASGERADSGVFGRRSRVTPLGEGGNVSLVGLNSLVVGGEIDASSAKGARKGSIRFDANEAMIGDRNVRSRLGGARMPRVGMIDAQTVSAALVGADVSIVARGQNEYGKKGSIYVSGPVVWHSDSALTLQAAGDISVHDTVRATGKYAAFNRQAHGPLLQSMSEGGRRQGRVKMTGEHASSINARPPVVPRVSGHPYADPLLSASFGYSVAAPARIERGRVAAPGRLLNSRRAQRSQLNGQQLIQNTALDSDDTITAADLDATASRGSSVQGGADLTPSRRASLQLTVDAPAASRPAVAHQQTVLTHTPRATRGSDEKEQVSAQSDAGAYPLNARLDEAPAVIKTHDATDALPAAHIAGTVMEKSNVSFVSRWWARLSGGSITVLQPFSESTVAGNASRSNAHDVVRSAAVPAERRAYNRHVMQQLDNQRLPGLLHATRADRADKADRAEQLRAEEQKTRSEALAFRSDSPAESMVRSVGHVYLRLSDRHEFENSVDSGADKRAEKAIEKVAETQNEKTGHEPFEKGLGSAAEKPTNKIADQLNDLHADSFVNAQVAPL